MSLYFIVLLKTDYQSYYLDSKVLYRVTLSIRKHLPHHVNQHRRDYDGTF